MYVTSALLLRPGHSLLQARNAPPVPLQLPAPGYTQVRNCQENIFAAGNAFWWEHGILVGGITKQDNTRPATSEFFDYNWHWPSFTARNVQVRHEPALGWETFQPILLGLLAKPPK